MGKIKIKLIDIIAILSFISIIIILVNITSVFIKISDFKKEMTGKASAYVNLSVSSSVTINLTRDSVEWGSGRVDIGSTNATLYTQGDNNASVSNGNWSVNSAKAFVVENTGNINVSLSLQNAKNANDFFASVSGLNQEYKLNVTNKEAGGCSGDLLNIWIDVNKTSGGTKYCTQLSSLDSKDEVFIDVWLMVPYDASNTGTLSDTLTVIASSAG
jgi:hypothetical protein